MNISNAVRVQSQRVNNVEIKGSISDESVNFIVSLPPSYFADTSRQYPVLFQLHGANESYKGSQVKVVSDFFENVWAKDVWEEAILVFPDGKSDSMWSDSKDRTIQVETNIIKEIIPYVDANYRTRPNAQNRFIQGFSMGGFGALKLITKYPELFNKAMIIDGALHTWPTISAIRPGITSKIFSNNENYFNETSNAENFLNQNMDLFMSEARLFFGHGTMNIVRELNTKALSYIDKIMIPYVINNNLNCGHNLECLLNALGHETFRYFSN